MTKEQLDTIRARHVEGFAPRMADATLLLEEVDRLTSELARRDAESAADLGRNQVLGWEIDELSGKRCITGNEFAEYDTFCGKCIHCAFRRGVNAAADKLDRLLTERKATAIWASPDELRNIPDPEYQP